MPEIDRLIGRGEQILYASRKHPSGLYRRGIAFVFAVVLGSLAGFIYNPSSGDDIVDWVVGAIVALISLRFLFAVLRWRSEHVALTRKRLIVTSGLFRRQVTTLPVSRIRNVTLTRTLGARMQLYGDVVLDIGDHGIVEVRKVPRVRRFHELLVQQMSGGPEPLPRQGLHDPDDHDPDDDDTGEIPTVVL